MTEGASQPCATRALFFILTTHQPPPEADFTIDQGA